jgi:phytoene synthase
MDKGSNDLLEIFKRGSITYFNSSRLFPRRIREEVTKLYAFVRLADDMVDSIPQRVEDFYRFREDYERAERGEEVQDRVIREFVELKRRRGFRREWVEGFLNSMEMDLHKRVYETETELLEYMHGSAEVVGLMMARIMGLSPEADPYAMMLGRAMQYVNFIRDLSEDIDMGRQYLPLQEAKSFGLEDLTRSEIQSKEENFRDFMRSQVLKYLSWQGVAEKGYRYIPLRLLVPVKTAADMYKWTARVIYGDPFIVLRRKVKPRKERIIAAGLINVLGVRIWRITRT